jgi:hypothetical protein
VVGFDLWSPFDYYDFGFTETLPWFDRFDWCGYGSQNFYENIGSVALFQYIFMVRLIMNPVFTLLQKLGVRGMIPKYMASLRWTRNQQISGTILIFLEVYFELIIGSLLALKMFDSIEKEDRTGTDQWTIDSAVAFLIPVILLPIFVVWYSVWHVRWLTNYNRE